MFTILEELSRPPTTARGAQSLAALARACAAPKASILALLTGMVALGYLIRNQDGYRAGPRLQTLALRESAGLDFAQVAQPIMAALVDATGETVLLGVATSSGEQVSYIAKVESSNPVRYTVSLNERRELYCAATGKIVLAWKSPVEVTAYLRKRRLIAFTPHTRTKASQLIKEVAEIRDRRLAETREELVLGAYALAVPVVDHTGNLIAALTLAGPVSRISAHRRTLIPQLKRSGEALDALLREFPDLQIPRVA